jgi:AcrR family transcriptional regulator
MSPRTPGPRASVRRSHAERTAQTRERVLSAVVESIAEIGYPRTTAAEIARRAGVTWGAVQHHFGDKDGILQAVLEESFDRFAEQLSDAPREGAGIEERASMFVERAWGHFASPHYRSTLEILLNLPADGELSWQTGMLSSWSEIWLAYFPGSSPGRRRTLELMHYTISVLSGLAITRLLEGGDSRVRARELSYLKDTLCREVGQPSRGGQR